MRLDVGSLRHVPAGRGECRARARTQKVGLSTPRV
jgi:hypothetical protein